MSRWRRSASWTADSARHSFDADPRHVAGVEFPPLAERLLEVAATDEFHPEADPAVDLVGVVDDGDVRMAHAREQAGFLENRLALGLRSARVQELDGDLAVELRIPGAENLAERSLPDALEDLQPSPALELLFRDLVLFRYGGVAGQLAVELGDARQDLELPDDFGRGRTRRGRRGGPVDGMSVENGFRQLVERRIFSFHGPSLRPAARERAWSPCAPRPRSAFRAGARARRRCTRALRGE